MSLSVLYLLSYQPFNNELFSVRYAIVTHLDTGLILKAFFGFIHNKIVHYLVLP